MKRKVKRIDFVQYHGLDHWPFTRDCRQMPYGGGFYHLKLAWDYRRRDQVLKFWHHRRCRRGIHEYILYSVGHHPGKKCIYCSHPGILTRQEIQEMQASWPTYINAPGDDNVVEKEEEGPG